MASQQQHQQPRRRWFPFILPAAAPPPSAAAAPPRSGLRPRFLAAPPAQNSPPAPSVTPQTTPAPKSPAASSPAPSTTLAIASSPLSAPSNSPVKKPASRTPSPPPQPPSPQPSATDAVSSAIITNRAQTQVSSPRIINTTWSKTPPQSPQLKPIITHTQAAENNHVPKTPTEAEQIKTVLLRKTPDGKEDVHEKLFDSKKFAREIITLAGENKGAVMGFDKAGNAEAEEEEEKSNINVEKSHKSNMEKQSALRKKIFVNSNLQEVNNSISCNSSFKHNNPGAHISFYKYGDGGRGLQLKDHIKY